jgi:ABC-type nickel/cobalt efflux system permease component RcnA
VTPVVPRSIIGPHGQEAIMNKMALGFLALIVLCIVMWLMSVARRRQQQWAGAYQRQVAGRHQRQGARGLAAGAAAATDADNAGGAVITPVPGADTPFEHHHHHHPHHHDQPADSGASSAHHGGHSSVDVGGGHFDAGGGHSH